MSDGQYNWVYKELVQGPDDVVGALAYILYKQHKIAFIEDTKAKHGREPNEEEMACFRTITCLPVTLSGFKERAEVLADEFLEVALQTKLQQAEVHLVSSATITEIKGVKTDINLTIKGAEQILDSKLDAIIGEFGGRKGFWGWLRDIGANLASTFGTILLIGALIIGYREISDLINKAEDTMGVMVAKESVQVAPDAHPTVEHEAGKP